MKTTDKSTSVLSPAQKAAVILALTEHVQSECSVVDMEQRFRDSLDECNPEVSVGSLSWAPSRVLETMDPVAFRCGVSDSSDHENVVEIEGEYYDSDKVDEAREEFVADLQTELDEAQTGLDVEDDLDEGETLNEETVADLKVEIARLEASIELAESQSF
jgi:hypothetical protein